MKTMVMSLGGSLIVPDKVDEDFVEKFKKVLRSNYKKYKFVLVCGGGAIAREYINALKDEGKNGKELALAGIRATRMNAQFIMQVFGKEANDTLPEDMEDVKGNLRKNKGVVCGALRYAPNETSDGTAAKLANFLKSPFINLTNVPGLYTEDPKKNKNAKFIPYISWKDFNKIAQKIKFKAGQHFILDQQAAKIIKKHRIKTYMLGRDIKNLDKFLKNKKFIGTAIGH